MLGALVGASDTNRLHMKEGNESIGVSCWGEVGGGEDIWVCCHLLNPAPIGSVGLAKWVQGLMGFPCVSLASRSRQVHEVPKVARVIFARVHPSRKQQQGLWDSNT